MIKAKLFDYHDSQIYYKKYGISPELHYSRLSAEYGKRIAISMIDRNMMKAFEEKQKEERCILEDECPF